MIRSLFSNLLGQPDPTLTEDSIYVFASVVLGLAMAQLIELPALKLRERLFGRKENGGMPLLVGEKIKKDRRIVRRVQKPMSNVDLEIW